MASENSLDDARRKALDNYELWDKLTKIFIGLVVALEIGLGIALIWLTDFWDPVQRLIFLAAATIYAPMVLLVMTVGYRVERNTLCVLKAIELLKERPEETEDTEDSS